MNVWIEKERAKIHFETFDSPGWILSSVLLIRGWMESRGKTNREIDGAMLPSTGLNMKNTHSPTSGNSLTPLYLNSCLSKTVFFNYSSFRITLCLNNFQFGDIQTQSGLTAASVYLSSRSSLLKQRKWRLDSESLRQAHPRVSACSWRNSTIPFHNDRNLKARGELERFASEGLNRQPSHRATSPRAPRL